MNITPLGVAPPPLPPSLRSQGANRRTTDQSQTEPSVNLGEVVRAVVRQWRIITLCSFLLLVVTMLDTVSSGMVFVSQGSLYLGELNAPPSPGLGQTPLFPEGSSDLASESKIVQSRHIVQRAVLASGLNVVLSPQGWEPPSYLGWRISGRNLDLLRGAHGSLRVTATPTVDGAIPPQTLTLTIKSSAQVELLGEKERRTANFGQPVLFGEHEVIVSRGALRRPLPGERYNVVIKPLQAVVSEVAAALTIGAGDESKVLQLSYKSDSPFVARDFLTYLLGQYLKERHEWRTQNARAADEVVANQLSSLRQALDETGKRIVDFEQDHSTATIPTDTSSLADLVNKSRHRQADLRLQVSMLKQVLGSLRNPHATTEAYMLGETDDVVLRSMATNLNEERRRLTQLTSEFQRDTKEVKNQERVINAQRNAVRAYVEGRLKRARNTLRETHVLLAEYEEQLESAPSTRLGLQRMEHESEVYSKVFSALLEQRQEAAVQKASTLSRNRVLDAPQLSFVEESPALGIRLASAPLGAIIGFVIVVLRLIFAQAIRNSAEARSLASDTPVFGTLRAFRPPPAPEAIFGTQETQAAMRFLGLEREACVRGLRSILYNLYACHDGDCKVVLVTSPNRGDGKTVCTLSLAALLVANGERTLVIQSRPRTSGNSGSAVERHGPRDVLARRRRWANVVRTVSSEYGRFDYLGPGAATRLLTRFSPGSVALDELRNAYDVVLIDGTSCPAETDTVILNEVADVTLSILRVGNTNRDDAKVHLSEVARTRSLHGIVLNLVDSTRNAPVPASDRG